MFIQSFKIRITLDQAKDVFRIITAEKGKSCVQSVLHTSIVQVLFKYVKRNKKIILQKGEDKTGVGDLPEEVYVLLRVLVKFIGAFFEKDDDINVFNIMIRKMSCICFTPDFLILPQEQVRAVAGTALSGKGISYALDLNIGKTAVFQADHDIHDKERGSFGKAAVVIGYDLYNLDFSVKEQGQDLIQVLGNRFRIDHFLKDPVAKYLHPLYTGTEIQKFGLLFIGPAAVDTKKPLLFMDLL